MKKKIFILDGPDGTGKTTLASKLSDTYNIPIFHLTYINDPEKHADQFYKVTDKIINWIGNKNDGFIIDRYILSELVYRKVYRPEQPLIKEADVIYDFMEHRASLGEIDVIITLPHDKERWFQQFKELEKNREEMYTSEKISEVYDEYLNYWKKLRYNKNVMRYDMFENMDGANKGKIFNINE